MTGLDIIGTLVYLAALALSTFAQGTNATCEPQYEWMSNSHGHNPCLLSAYLVSECEANPNDAYTYSIDTGYYYGGPWKESPHVPCECNTVYYAVISACAACQGQLAYADPWTGWSFNCSSPAIATWPKQVPQGTSIPAWAFLDVTRTDNFNVTIAKDIASSNSSEMSPSLTSTNSSTTTTASAASSQNSTKAIGPIVGGVIGGVAILVFAGVTVYFIRSRANARRHQRAASTSLMEVLTSYDKTPGTPTTASQGYTPGVYSHMLYNPNNPSTFPAAAQTFASDGNLRYSGFPEI